MRLRRLITDGVVAPVAAAAAALRRKDRDLVPEPVADRLLDERVREVEPVLATWSRLAPALRTSLRGRDVLTGRELRRTDIEANFTLTPTVEVGTDVVFAELEGFWTSRGYEIVDRSDGPPRTLRVRHPDDGVRLAVREGRSGNRWLVASITARAE